MDRERVTMLACIDPFTVNSWGDIGPKDTLLPISLPEQACCVNFAGGEYFSLTLSNGQQTERVRVLECLGSQIRVDRSAGMVFGCGATVTHSLSCDDIKVLFKQWQKEMEEAEDEADNPDSELEEVNCDERETVVDDAQFAFTIKDSCDDCFFISGRNLKDHIERIAERVFNQNTP